MAAGRRALDERPRNRAELGPLLAEEFPGLDVESMTIAVTYLVPVVQATPRGVWGDRAQPRWMTMSGWLGDRQPGPLDLATLVQRYLRAFGPATVKDVQAWCGLTRLREVADGLGSRLRRYRSDDGAELLDLADATLPDPDSPAPVRFLAEYDNATLGYADRRRILADGDHQWLSAGPGGAVGSVLVDGHIRATWALRRSGPSVSLEVHQAVRLDDATRAEVEAEAQRLLAFLTDGGTEEGAATVWWSG
jgi:winged helix DNA-binding protein